MTERASHAMLEALGADGPDPEHADKLALFGQFVGAWELDCIEYPADGSPSSHAGEWIFGWVLNGRAIQDVWILPSREQRRHGDGLEIEWGTAVRFYDSALDAWRVNWSGPGRGRAYTFLVRAVADEIVLEGASPDGERLRWTFSDIRADFFRWRNEICQDDGEWRLQQEMFVGRKESR